MIVRRVTLAALGALWLVAAPATAQPFDWDRLGAAFCALTTAGDIAAARPLISASLAREIEVAFGRAGRQPPPSLFQTYGNMVPECTARTRNAAIIEIRRSGPNGAAPAWTEYAVVVPEADGTSRIDDVLFATRRSDTLRARLGALGR